MARKRVASAQGGVPEIPPRVYQGALAVESALYDVQEYPQTPYALPSCHAASWHTGEFHIYHRNQFTLISCRSGQEIIGLSLWVCSEVKEMIRAKGDGVHLRTIMVLGELSILQRHALGCLGIDESRIDRKSTRLN